MLKPVPAKFEGRLSAEIVMTMGGTMAAATPRAITENSKTKPDV